MGVGTRHYRVDRTYESAGRDFTATPSVISVKTLMASPQPVRRRIRGTRDGEKLDSDQVTIKIINSLPATAVSLTFTPGAELVVDSLTADVLVLSGTAIRLPAHPRVRTL